MNNLFELANLQLKKENKEYSYIDVLEYAIKIRYWMDNNSLKRVKLSKEELKKNHRLSQLKYATKNIIDYDNSTNKYDASDYGIVLHQRKHTDKRYLLEI